MSRAHKGVRSRRCPRQRRTEPLASVCVQPEKLFRIEEANAAVPRLALWIERLQRGALGLEAEMCALATARGVALEAIVTEDLLRERPAAGLLVEELDGIVREIEESGAHLKDVRLGLIDFPAEKDGEVVYLCWQFGEPEVAFWHRVEEGFSGRQPLPGAARARTLQ